MCANLLHNESFKSKITDILFDLSMQVICSILYIVIKIQHGLNDFPVNIS